MLGQWSVHSGFVPFTRASSAGLTGKRVIGCLRSAATSFMTPSPATPVRPSNAANPKGRVVGCPGDSGKRQSISHTLWRSGRSAIKAWFRRHVGTCREITTQSSDRPDRPAGRALKHASDYVALLANRPTIGYTSRLASARLSTRRGRVKWISDSLWGTGQAAPPLARRKGERPIRQRHATKNG